MENKINFVNPKLSNTSTNKDVLDAIKQFEEVSKSIIVLEDKNEENYANFINNYRSIIKKTFLLLVKLIELLIKVALKYTHFQATLML